eukprot:CAMPEP_0115242638 /NCGR_PEP_ID=MMETSP0270-20121206/39057_1 /TAXON_ID=71861 /ORGANISM="Scrippsiella trochoidea, Strain CCMP3099" /LENGTH=268 /DNA_ID=CAMNT_0002657713 /DNA_START=466 /DNA_END=1273 /DNA_ORIENTATION=+
MAAASAATSEPTTTFVAVAAGAMDGATASGAVDCGEAFPTADLDLAATVFGGLPAVNGFMTAWRASLAPGAAEALLRKGTDGGRWQVRLLAQPPTAPGGTIPDATRRWCFWLPATGDGSPCATLVVAAVFLPSAGAEALRATGACVVEGEACGTRPLCDSEVVGEAVRTDHKADLVAIPHYSALGVDRGLKQAEQPLQVRGQHTGLMALSSNPTDHRQQQGSSSPAADPICVPLAVQPLHDQNDCSHLAADAHFALLSPAVCPQRKPC